MEQKTNVVAKGHIQLIKLNLSSPLVGLDLTETMLTNGAINQMKFADGSKYYKHLL